MSHIVVTGARGYIGSALVQALAARGHALCLVSRSPPAEDAGGAGRFRHVQADLRNEDGWHGLLQDAAAVVHLAARTDLRAAEADPVGDYDLNVEPVRALGRAAARRGEAIPVVFASTVTIFGIDPQLPANECAPDRPSSVYDRHKLECEAMLREATRRGLLQACTLRLANVYGYGAASINSNRGILNAMMRRAADGQPLTLYGDGAYIRDFVHLDDVVDAFVQAVTEQGVRDGGHYVIASGRGHSLAEAYEWIAEAAQAHTGRRVEIRRVAEPADLQPIERRNFIGDSRLFQERANWRPTVGLKAGINDYFTRAVSHPEVALG